MKSQTPTPGKGGTPKRLTLLIFGVSILTAASSYGYREYSQWRRHESLMPRLKLSSLVRDIRKFEALTGRVPRSFKELESHVWKHAKGKPVFDLNGAAYTFANYFYLFHGIDARTVTVWAVPVGPRRDETSTHFVVVSPESVAAWKGASLRLDDLAGLTANPTAQELARLGLIRQAGQHDANRQEGPEKRSLRTPSTRTKG
jgi:hypothetical protein